MLRFATGHDLIPLLRLLERMHAEIGLFMLDRQKVRAEVENAISERLVHVLTKGDGQIIGSIGLMVWEPWYSSDKCLSDRWIFLAPEHRSYRSFVALIRCAAERAEALCMPLVVSLYSTKDTERKERLFGREMEQVVAAWHAEPGEAPVAAGGYWRWRKKKKE